MTVGQRIRFVAGLKGIEMKDLAEKAGVTRGTFDKWIAAGCDANMTLTSFEAMSDALGESLQDMWYGTKYEKKKTIEKMETGRKVYVLRNINEWSRNELSEKSGVNYQTIRNIEECVCEASPRSIKRLSKAFHVSEDFMKVVKE